MRLGRVCAVVGARGGLSPQRHAALSMRGCGCSPDELDDWLAAERALEARG